MAANGAWSAKEYVEGLTGSSTLGHVTGALTGVPLAAAGALAGRAIDRGGSNNNRRHCR